MNLRSGQKCQNFNIIQYSGPRNYEKICQKMLDSDRDRITSVEMLVLGNLGIFLWL
jgi:hypothetical protein